MRNITEYKRITLPRDDAQARRESERVWGRGKSHYVRQAMRGTSIALGIIR